MTEESQELFDFIKLVKPHFDPFKAEHLISFASLKLGWPDDKVKFCIGTLEVKNKITVENNIIKIN